MITLDLPRREARRSAERLAPRSSLRASYAGAASNRLTADWVAVILSADLETRTSLRTLRARSRQLCRDNAHAAGVVRSLKDNILGADGIDTNPRMRNPADRSFLKEFNRAAYEAMTAWGDRETCSADGQNSWAELQRLALGTWFTDGEAFVRRLPGFDNPFSYSLQLIDADLLDEGFNLAGGIGQNEITQGIEIDRFGRPVAYHFWDRHPRDPRRSSTRQRIPASEILHLFQQLRAGQRRGIPLLTPVLIALRMLDGYTEAEITQARVAAASNGFFTRTGADAANATIDEGDDATPIELDAEPGVARQLPVGWKFEQWDPTHPNGNFGEFQKAMLHVIAQGIGTSYMTLSGDLSDTSFSSGRIGVQSERDAYATIQGWIGARLVLPVYRDVIRYASLSGMLVLPTPEVSRWLDCKLEPRGWGWIDPKTDAVTASMEVDGLFNSPQRICAERGLDYEEILDEIKEARTMCAERGIPWPDYGMAKGSPPAGTAPGNQPPPTKPPKAAAAFPTMNGNGHGILPAHTHAEITA